jgi:6-phospho-3-hexuloisomerase
VSLDATLKSVQKEVEEALQTVHADDVSQLIKDLCAAQSIFVAGMGRVGLVSRAFAMRLMHLGLSAFWIGEVTTPSLSPGDLLLVCSGSGETAPLRVMAELADQIGVRLATITRNPDGSIGRLADTVVRLMAAGDQNGRPAASCQPMTTLFEQSLFLLLESIVLILMDRLGETEETMAQRHFNLER